MWKLTRCVTTAQGGVKDTSVSVWMPDTTDAGAAGRTATVMVKRSSQRQRSGRHGEVEDDNGRELHCSNSEEYEAGR